MVSYILDRLHTHKLKFWFQLQAVFASVWSCFYGHLKAYKQHDSHVWKSSKGILCTNTNVLQCFPDFFNQPSTNFWGSFWHQISTASYNEKRLCTTCRLCNIQVTINSPKLDVWWGKWMGKLPLCPCAMSWKDVKIIGAMHYALYIPLLYGCEWTSSHSV
jgi:hypothetical protein